MRGHHGAGLLLLALLLAAGPARAAAPTMILDINASGVDSEDEASIEGNFLPLGRVALVPVREPSSGRELWVTDGTDAGTRPLLDLCPGPCGTSFDMMGVAGGVAIFFASPNLRNGTRTLWRTDGTPAGTFPLARPGEPGPVVCDSSQPAALGSFLLFTALDPLTEDRCELWKTDGTVAGTVPVSTAWPRRMTTVGDQVFFVGQVGQADLGRELWRSDGTPEGTVRLHQWGAPSVGPSHLTAVGTRLFFLAPDGGLELWTSDGTPGGTRPLTRFEPEDPFVPRPAQSYENTYVVQALEGFFYFLANDGVAGRELWRSDGTEAGTRPVTAFSVASPFLGLETWSVQALAGRVFFAAHDGASGHRLWSSDGRPESTARISGCPEGCPELPLHRTLVRQAARIFFAGHTQESELWVTDGSGRGTRRLFRSGEDRGVAALVPLLGRVFFVGRSGIERSVYVTDGTLDGTTVLTRGTYATDGIYSAPPVALGSFALIELYQEETPELPLWRTDGTPAGTVPVTKIGAGGLGSRPGELVTAGDAVRFLATNGASTRLWTSHGTAETTASLEAYGERLLSLGTLTLLDSSWELARSDGTPAGTFALTSSDDGYRSGAVALASRAVFRRADPGTLEPALWATDGTVEGTGKIFDVPAAGLRFLAGPVAAGHEAFFSLRDGDGRDQLWVTDGTAAGTRPVTPAGPFRIEPDRGRVLQAARLGSKVLFNGRESTTDGLWRSDGTAAGTYQLGFNRAGEALEMIVHQNALYFLAYDLQLIFTPSIGLWRTDGTEAGTVLLGSWETLATPPSGLTVFRDLLYLAAGDEKGLELWRSDGTPAGTFEVRDINPGALSASPSELTVLGDRLYFAASDRDHGNELWESDGTAAGTRLVQDIAPDAGSSAPRELTAAGGRLYFTADDGVHGREPWVYTPGGAACVPSDTVLCLRGGRFKVEADWRDFEGGSGRGHAVALTTDTGYFWFFDRSNVEVILKVLDGQGLNGHHWVFYGALSSVEYALTVTDTQTGAARRYTNLPGRLGSVADTQAFGPLGASAPGVVTTGPAPELGEAIVTARTTKATGSCAPSATRLCLQGGRFAVETRWKAQGQNGTGKAVPLAGGDTGYFWFFDESNVEVVLKVLDGTPLNGKFWVFYGALSNVEYTLTVTDTQTGAVKTYTNPSGRLASVADTNAF